jgi:hypothetical protein
MSILAPLRRQAMAPPRVMPPESDGSTSMGELSERETGDCGGLDSAQAHSAP